MPRAVTVVVSLALVAGLAAGGYFAYEHFRAKPAPDQPAAPPVDPVAAGARGKLVVLVVFDQMRGDYLDRWGQHFGPGGFERVKKEGVWYSDVQIPYACTSTGPGHASLVSGAPPSGTGIIENEWFDRKAAKRVYCCQPSRPFDRVPPLPVAPGQPTRGSELGFSPENLLAETVGDKLKAATTGTGRVFSLSIKDRTAVLMGGQKPDAAYCFDTRDGAFHTGMYYREQPHPWVAEFNTAKPRHADAWFEQKWGTLHPDAATRYKDATGNTDDAAGEGFGFNGQSRIFPHPFKGKLAEPGRGYYEAVECSPAGNELLFRFAQKAITAEKLGQGETTDLLCLSFSSNDLIGHIYGPDSWEMFDVTLRSDRLIADLLAFLDAAVGKDRYTLVISADHGVCPLPEGEKNPYPNAKRLPVTEIYPALAAKLDDAFGPGPAGPTRWFESTDAKELDRLWPWVYLNENAIKGRGLTVDEVAAVAREWLVGRDYLATAFTRRQLETETFPADSFGAKAKLAYRPERCGNVIVVPKPGVLVTGYANGTNHGSPQPYDSHVSVLAVGAGVPALGKKAERRSSLIVAPMLARALGIDPPKDAVEKSPY